MSSRLKKFHSYAKHGWLSKSYAKLSASEREMAEQFIRENDAKSKGDFELAVNRMFIDRPNKPKNWTIILELLANSNSGEL